MAQAQTKALDFEVNQVYEPLSISKPQLLAAKDLSDLNKNYEKGWVKEYKKVEVQVSIDDDVFIEAGKSDVLNEKQKLIMAQADHGSEININVTYLPNNDLKSNEFKENHFSFKVNPTASAKFPGGENKLHKYLESQVVKHVPAGTFVDYDLAASIFTINETGEVVDAHIKHSSGNETLDQLMLKAICNMPSWIPAQYDENTKVSQTFAFTLGNHHSCHINTLHIRKLNVDYMTEE